MSSHIQEIGRVMRRMLGLEKTAIWLDHSGNIERFAVDMFAVWQDGAGDLSDAEKRDSTPRKRDETTRERAVCPQCSGALRAGNPSVPLPFKPWGFRKLEDIRAPEFVYSDFYARGYTSLTVAPPKVGKSMLGLAEGLDMASGAGFLTSAPRDSLRVLYYNAEDDMSVLEGRIAALLGHYRLQQSSIAETLYPVSGVDADGFYLVSGPDGTINEGLFGAIENFITANKIDVLIFDPLQDLSRSPETNEVFRILGQRLRHLASSHRVALGLVHHTRKLSPGTGASIDDARGGGALRGTARFNRLLLPMNEDEGSKAGVGNHRHFMRIAEAESRARSIRVGVDDLLP